MKTSPLFFFFITFFLSTYTYTSISIPTCTPTSCGGGPVIQFPFQLRTQQPDRCAYPRFDLLCQKNQSQTILNLPNSGEFMVTYIDYPAQSIYINDPFNCLPKRLLSFNLSGSQFKGPFSRSFTFFNCTTSSYVSGFSIPIGCLSGDNYTVVAVDSDQAATSAPPPGCWNISTVSVPVQVYFHWNSSELDLSQDLLLTWGVPSCGACEIGGGTCGFKSDTNLEVGCSATSKRRLPRSAKYGIIIGAVIPGLVCLIGLASYIGSKIRAYGHNSPPNTELSTSIMANQSVIVVMGLDRPTIESYPKTVLGESGRLPKPNDSTCPICLSEYKPKETLRTIPECDHYFHADCVDEWLKMNATCPLCRTLSEGSSVVTPCTSMSSLLSSSQSS